jgi:uncharacterized protein (DUF1697 family)
MTEHVALLRGINVGGKNRITMADLRAILGDRGYHGVATYIASGNVLLTSERDAPALEADLEALLEERYGTSIAVVVRTHQEMRAVVGQAPVGFGGPNHHCDVVFLKDPLTVGEAVGALQLREGVDRVWPGERVAYFARLSARRSQSRLSTIVGTPQYQLMTIRNWSTTTRLLELLDERVSASPS